MTSLRDLLACYHQWDPVGVPAHQRLARWLALSSAPVGCAVWLPLTSTALLEAVCCAACSLHMLLCTRLCWQAMAPSIHSPSKEAAYGCAYCKFCKSHWRLQDHHCGSLGICVHEGNREAYCRFIAHTLGTSVMLLALTGPRFCRPLAGLLWESLQASSLSEEAILLGTFLKGHVVNVCLHGVAGCLCLQCLMLIWQQRAFTQYLEVFSASHSDAGWLANSANKALLNIRRRSAVRAFKEHIIARLEAEMLARLRAGGTASLQGGAGTLEQEDVSEELALLCVEGTAASMGRKGASEQENASEPPWRHGKQGQLTGVSQATCIGACRPDHD
mmetsp:Transcript_25558/g.73433  ORF Transcript_25558/g.73433 Transcript_25558/m.73433 type:complete len:331 (-) Transcript_25558:71-1063(-)